MAIRRFKSRAIAGRKLKSGTLAQLTAAAAILDSAERGDGDAGTYHAPEAAEVISTAVFGPASGTAGAYGVSNLVVGNVIQDVAFGVGLTGTGANLLATHTTYLAIEATRNDDNLTVAGEILTGKSVKIRNITYSGSLTFAGTTYVLDSAPDYGIGGTGGAKTATLPATSVVLTAAWGGPATYGVGGTGSTPQATLTLGANVISSASSFGKFGALTVPTYHEAEVGEVKNLVTFGALSALTGTYSPGGTYVEGQAAHQAADLAFLNLNVDEMIVANTTIQAQYGCNAGTAVVEEHTANQVLKSAGGNYNDDNLSVGNVRPVAFGLSQTGTLANLVATDAAYVALEATRNSKTAGAGQILTGYSVTIAGSATNGTFDESTRNIDPGVANVKDGVTYKILNASLEGTYESGAGGTYPAAAYVHSDAGDYGPTGVEYTPSLSALANWCLVAGITWPALDEVDGDVAFGPVTGLEYVGTGVNATTLGTTLDARGVTTANVAQTGDSFTRLGAPAGASVSADIAAVKADTGNLITRITANLFSGITKLANWLRLLARSDAAITADAATELAEINATQGTGAGDFAATTDSLENIRDTPPLGTAMRGTDGAYTGTPPTADAIGTDAAGKVLATPSQKIVTNASGQVSASNALTGAEMFAAVLTSQMTEAYAADGVAPTLAQAIFLIQQSLHEFSISGTTRTVKKLDGVETAATFTLDSATAPTSTTRAS